MKATTHERCPSCGGNVLKGKWHMCAAPGARKPVPSLIVDGVSFRIPAQYRDLPDDQIERLIRGRQS